MVKPSTIVLNLTPFAQRSTPQQAYDHICVSATNSPQLHVADAGMWAYYTRTHSAAARACDIHYNEHTQQNACLHITSVMVTFTHYFRDRSSKYTNYQASTRTVYICRQTAGSREVVQIVVNPASDSRHSSRLTRRIVVFVPTSARVTGYHVEHHNTQGKPAEQIAYGVLTM